MSQAQRKPDDAPGLGAIDPNAFYTAPDVAWYLFGKRPSWFYGHVRRELMRRDGFPKPISSIGRPRWLGQDLLDWAMRKKSGEGPDFSSDQPSSAVVDLTEHLRRRAQEVVGKKRPA